MLRDFLLDSLAFTAMNDREEQVTEAYSETFDWIYRDDSHDFGAWLRNDNTGAMYWINGWAGSGKSTLMRYINERKRTKELLKHWGGQQPVTTASFFFWESGTAVQRSQAGLLRSLLHQLLIEQPNIIPTVFPELWSEIWLADARTRVRLMSSWSIPQLSSGFRRFFEVNKEMKICLFVDGLDEFEGDHQVMIDLLEHVCRQPHTKVCVSSRPWRVFEDAFRNIPALRLQDLTASDMTRFVRGKLLEDRRLGKLVKEEPEVAAELVTLMVQRADGVFLWVSLAVRTLLERFIIGDTLSTIRDRLRELPRSLDDLFHHLLFCEQSNSAGKISHIFQLMRAREIVCDFTRDDDATSLTVWEMALTDNDAKELALTAPVQRVADEARTQRCQRAIANIVESCAGLVEVHPSKTERQRATQLRNRPNNPFLPQRKITYLHRTVKDFLANDIVWQGVLAYAPELDPHLCHLRASVLRFKLCLEQPRRQRAVNDWWPQIVLSMTHARYTKSVADTREETFELLNALDDTLNWFWPPRGSVARDSWARSCFGTYEERGSTAYPDPFLSLATKFGVARYVETYLDTLEYEYEEEKPLLSYAVEYLVHRQSSVYPLSAPQLVSRIQMSKPKKKPPPGLKTPWVIALETVQQAHRRKWIEKYDVDPDGTARWAGILRMFLEHGADPGVVLHATHKDPVETALELVTRVFEAYRSREVQRVRELLLAKLNASSGKAI
ncbi:hypothetical protein BDZ97DRAFT_1650798 [Flammula alnicola]|nr:hypothetical protein BDZ97DRAFT_1650798 [Flammula alnicola]